MEGTHNIQPPSVTPGEVDQYLKDLAGLDPLAGTDKTVDILGGDGVNVTRYANVDAALSGGKDKPFVKLDSPDVDAAANAGVNAESVTKKLTEPATHKTVMFDMYALMELMQEMAQELRNAMRELRQTELSGIQANIKAQANAQLSGAIAQVVVGCVMSGIQLGVTAFGAAKMAGSYKEQMNTAELKTELENSKADMKLATTGGTGAEAATQQVDAVARETGLSEESVLKMMPNATRAKSDFDIATGKVPVEDEAQRVAAYRRLVNDDSAELPKVDGEVRFNDDQMADMRSSLFESYEKDVDALVGDADLHKMARAIEIRDLPEGYADIIKENATISLGHAMDALQGKGIEGLQTAYLKNQTTATRIIGYGQLIQGLGQALSQGIAGIYSAKATELGAQKAVLEERLDQDKDLFQNALQLVEKAIQIFQAVTQAEASSIRDIMA